MSIARSRLPAIAVIAAMTAGGCRGPATVTPDRGVSSGYVVTLGNDTVSAESYTRVGDRIDGAVLRRVPRTTLLRYTLTLGPDGLPARLEYNTRLPDGGMLPNGASTVRVRFTGDSAITEIVRDSVTTVRVRAPNAHPDLDGAISTYGWAIAAVRRMGRDSGTVTAYVPGAPEGDRMPVARRAPNTWWLYSFGYPIEVTTDDRGNIVSVDATRTTFRIRSQRQSAIDIPAMAASFARREATAGPVGALSPRDTVRATVGGVRFVVDYSRPATRGRTIFGPDGVLGDTLWRTGANQSTRMTIDAPIVMAGQTLPPGTYVLTTLAVPGRYQLIFSEGDGERERLRVPLQATTLPQVVERFTIAIDPAGDRAGTIRLRWATMDLSLPFTVP